MLKTFVEKNHYSFHQSFNNWHDAIYYGAEPLLKDGTIDEEYIEQIIQNVETYGPYIMIDPGRVAMPHSTLGGKGVHNTAICFMKVEEPVVFDPEDHSKDARLFFTLAAVNPDEHLTNMMALANMLSTEGLIDDLLEVQNPEDLLKLHEKYFKI